MIVIHEELQIMNNLDKQIKKSVRYIRKRYKKIPKIGLILGFGLGKMTEALSNQVEFQYAKIPFFPYSNVKGHGNILVCGQIYEKDVIVMKGRFHYYEGWSMSELTFPIHVLKELGIEKLIITNASGGINPKFKVGDLMVINDHINLMGNNPLLGVTINNGYSFVDMSNAYNNELIKCVYKSAKEKKIKICQGIYAGMSGPSYETPAEIRMLQKLGADAVGMSTVPEVIVARQLNLVVLGISLITNVHSKNNKITHEDVLKASENAIEKFINLLKTVIKKI